MTPILAALAASALASEPAVPALEQPLALGSYVAVRGGSYEAHGLGGRIRWQPWHNVGIELYLEGTHVNWPGGPRHDFPNGFNVYRPIRIGSARIRPFFGFCDVVSLVGPTEPGAPRADDLLLGAHTGLGSEFPVNAVMSVFADAQVDAYAGHNRKSGGWTGSVGEDFHPFVTGQLDLGVQFHMPTGR